MTEVMNYAERNGEESESSTLMELFDNCLKLWDEIENTSLSSNDSEYQSMLKKAILMAENVTHMVNSIGMFSSNETVDEVASPNLKFLLLPALLGYFNMKIQPASFTISFRLDQISLAEEYYKDFLRRCKNYEVPEVEIPDFDNLSECDKSSESGSLNLQKMIDHREAAVARFKKNSAMDKKIAAMKSHVASFDDEKLREYHMLLLKRWVYRVLEEMQAIQLEKDVVKSAGEPHSNNKNSKKTAAVQPLKPIILVRTELQKKVFGAGYPSIPSMTVEEFYRQRYPDTEDKQANPAAVNSLQQMASDPDAANNAKEAEEIEEEKNIEKDDPEFLKNRRAFDDWKDDNRRGSGNRKNKG